MRLEITLKGYKETSNEFKNAIELLHNNRDILGNDGNFIGGSKGLGESGSVNPQTCGILHPEL